MHTKQQQKPMRSVWQSLLWKEWHEHKWKLVWLLLLILIPVLIFWKKGDPVFLPEAITTTFFLYSILGGLFLGMHTAAGEKGRGTMPFLQSLPVTMRKPAAIRLIVSWVTVVVPVIVLLSLAYVYLSWHGFTPASLLADKPNWSDQHGPFSTWGLQNWLLGYGISCVLGVSSLLLWMAATGVNRADEIGAGAMGFLTIVVVWFCLGGAAYQAEKLELQTLEECVAAAMATAPGSPAFLGLLADGSHMPFLVILAIAIVGHACVFAWYLRRFGRKAVRPARTFSKRVKATKSDWLAPPRRSQLTAIIWKQVHETGPLALMAAAAVLVIAVLIFWLNPSVHVRESRGEVLASLTLGVGFLVTVVAGQGVFLEDLKPKVGLFWRSRPVNTTLWFFVKFFTGLTVLVLTFGALFLLAFAFEDGKQSLIQDQAEMQVTSVALIFLLIYTISMASYCLGRQPIISVVAALGILFCGAQALDIVGRFEPHWSVGLGAIFVAQIAATAVAWLAVRNNWGWHR